MNTLASGLFLAVVNMAIINYLAAPVREKKPKFDLWFLVYVALITGFLISWFAGVNLFADQIVNELLGRILSGILVGGGSSLIHDVFDRPGGEVIELDEGEAAMFWSAEPHRYAPAADSPIPVRMLSVRIDG